MDSEDEVRLRQAYESLVNENAQLRAEIEQLRESAQRGLRLEKELRVVLSQLPAVLFTVDANLRLTAVMGAGLELMELDPERIIGRTLTEVLAFTDVSALVQVVNETLQGRPQELEFEHKNRLFQVWLEPMRTPENAIECVIGFCMDITDIRRLQKQIEQAQRLDSIGRLAGGIAHDFNNVLAGISGFAELAQVHLPEDHPVQAYLNQIQSAVVRSSQMVSQLLAFARRRVIYPQPMNLNEHLQQVLGLLEQIVGADIEMVYYLDPQLGTVRADPAQIEQVLVNLVTNARQAMPRGGKLTIETQNVVLDADYGASHWGVKAGEYVLIAISDTGVRIAEEAIPHLFEPFYSTRTTGTGLGLATVHGIVTQAQGYIWVYSEPGKGTTFKIYLPRVSDSTQPITSPTPTAPIQKGTERILLVEDNLDVLESTKALLQSLGYTVLSAVHPDEAIALARANPIDLLVTDVILPQMRGSLLAQTLQHMQPNLKVLFISGYTENSVIEHGELKPDVTFLAKPYTLAQLSAKIREVLASG